MMVGRVGFNLFNFIFPLWHFTFDFFPPKLSISEHWGTFGFSNFAKTVSHLGLNLFNFILPL